MIDWTFLAIPLLALPLVLLFRFVGCGELQAIAGLARPGYRDYIMGVNDNKGSVPWPGVVPSASDVLAYWRLVDVPTVVGSPPFAKDEKGVANGKYIVFYAGLPAQPPTAESPTSNEAPGSDAAPGYVFFRQPSLIFTDQAVTGVLFQGGYMSASYVDGLYKDEMTIECWVNCQWSPAETGNAHTLLFAGGYYQRPDQFSPGWHGFRIFADANNKWQVAVNTLADDGALSTSTLVTLNRAKYIVVTLANESGQTRVTLFVDTVNIESVLVPQFSRPDGSPFYVGLGNQLPASLSPVDGSDPTNITPTQPIMSQVQEVVLYNKVLDRQEMENRFALNQPVSTDGG